ncbi:MAG: PEP-CTERM sorting domain-containing protein [Proteobacteria bacterium]|nr:PEP-CTERM sorting domain-containing protein [Pseudomonadota bacterium]
MISLEGGGAFNLNSLKLGLGGSNYQVDGGFDLVTITGQKSANCQVDCANPTITLQVGYDWTPFVLSGFTGLSSVTVFQQILTDGGLPVLDQGGAPMVDPGWLAFDDIDYAVDPTGGLGGAIPEPASWALMIAGFGLLGAVLRRRAASAAV